MMVDREVGHHTHENFEGIFWGGGECMGGDMPHPSEKIGVWPTGTHPSKFTLILTSVILWLQETRNQFQKSLQTGVLFAITIPMFSKKNHNDVLSSGIGKFAGN